jgi:hypothetical protein
VGVLCGFGDEKELVRCGADIILPSTALLDEVLLEGKDHSHIPGQLSTRLE